MGPVCTRRSAPAVPGHERDLFGYDIEKATSAAMYRLGVCIESAAAEAAIEIRHEFAAARRLLGVWS